ncbi:MAG: GNAT family N-acetyltransferase [Pseudomonas sp.]|uniref:GNAT family N-acetyltransferase n=1 Tax=Pseudomonas sp. TaxID=306 RepID=UPI0027342CB6|nr:GNAT family N-acetyltransferase [Pseudomonas sp.]MDP3847039.1 GNAT family N-acetyltransferase [Pseudomonas sp.]
MQLTRRPVTEPDLAAICTFAPSAQELFFFYPKASHPLTPAQLQAAIDLRSDSTVVELNGEVVAFANFYRWETGGSCAIGNVIVAPHARGCGVARYLIEQMIVIAFTRHQAGEVTVSCFNQNVAGLLLYSTLGFTAYGIEARQDKSGQRVALIHLRLTRSVS